MASSTVPLGDRSVYVDGGAEREERMVAFFWVKVGGMEGAGAIAQS